MCFQPFSYALFYQIQHRIIDQYDRVVVIHYIVKSVIYRLCLLRNADVESIIELYSLLIRAHIRFFGLIYNHARMVIQKIPLVIHAYIERDFDERFVTLCITHSIQQTLPLTIVTITVFNFSTSSDILFLPSPQREPQQPPTPSPSPPLEELL